MEQPIKKLEIPQMKTKFNRLKTHDEQYSLKNIGQKYDQQAQKCTCCPYGFHIDVGFIKSFDKPLTTVSTSANRGRTSTRSLFIQPAKVFNSNVAFTMVSNAHQTSPPTIMSYTDTKPKYRSQSFITPTYSSSNSLSRHPLPSYIEKPLVSKNSQKGTYYIENKFSPTFNTRQNPSSSIISNANNSPLFYSSPGNLLTDEHLQKKHSNQVNNPNNIKSLTSKLDDFYDNEVFSNKPLATLSDNKDQLSNQAILFHSLSRIKQPKHSFKNAFSPVFKEPQNPLLSNDPINFYPHSTEELHEISQQLKEIWFRVNDIEQKASLVPFLNQKIKKLNEENIKLKNKLEKIETCKYCDKFKHEDGACNLFIYDNDFTRSGNDPANFETIENTKNDSEPNDSLQRQAVETPKKVFEDLLENKPKENEKKSTSNSTFQKKTLSLFGSLPKSFTFDKKNEKEDKTSKAEKTTKNIETKIVENNKKKKKKNELSKKIDTSIEEDLKSAFDKNWQSNIKQKSTFGRNEQAKSNRFFNNTIEKFSSSFKNKPKSASQQIKPTSKQCNKQNNISTKDNEIKENKESDKEKISNDGKENRSDKQNVELKLTVEKKVKPAKKKKTRSSSLVGNKESKANQFQKFKISEEASKVTSEPVQKTHSPFSSDDESLTSFDEATYDGRLGRITFSSKPSKLPMHLPLEEDNQLL